MKQKLALLTAVLLMAALVVVAKPTLVPQKYFSGTRIIQETPRPARLALDQIYTSIDVPHDIPDGPGGVTTSALHIPDGTTINDLNVMVSITHPWIRDLRISLISPNATEVVLLELFPGNDIVNMTDCWFDDDAGVLIDNGVPPFTGFYRPQNPLAVFQGISAQGDWTLRVQDEFRLDSGRVEAWAIDVNPFISLSGRVTNGLTGAGVSSAQIWAIAADTVSAITSFEGNYRLVSLPAGTYTLRFFKTGYDTTTIENVLIEVGNTATQNATMNTVGGYFEFASTSARVFIPDSNSAMMDLPIAADVVIGDIDVTLNVTHSYDPDLDLYLLEPGDHGGRDTVKLYGGSGGPGQNFINTRFDDQAETNIIEGVPPFTGSFHPVGDLLDFTNQSTSGTWSLLAIDFAMVDTGYIENFTLHITQSVKADEPPALHPASFVLSAYPNPFNASTEFNFELSQPALVELVVFDITGRRVAALLYERRNSGAHRVIFDASDLPSGVYIARLSTAAQSTSQKILLLK